MAELPVDRITVSTVGDSPENIRRLARVVSDLGPNAPAVRLQLSLHSPFQIDRGVLIPTTRGKELAPTLDAVDEYTAITGHPVKYNVVLMNGDGRGGFTTNATPNHAEAVARIITAPSRIAGVGQIHRRIKLSAFNPVPGIPFQTPSEAVRAAYVATLRSNGVEEIKTFKGSGINIDAESGHGGFACGQLAATTRETMRSATSK
jgi:adenine C2-methylase RlmN of 23S rRNA A2503 and tRNA A37